MAISISNFQARIRRCSDIGIGLVATHERRQGEEKAVRVGDLTHDMSRLISELDSGTRAVQHYLAVPPPLMNAPAFVVLCLPPSSCH